MKNIRIPHIVLSILCLIFLRDSLLGQCRLNDLDSNASAIYLFENNTLDSSGNNNNPTNLPNITYSNDAWSGSKSGQYNGSPVIMDLPLGNDTFRNKIVMMYIKPSNLTSNQVLMDEGGKVNGIILKLDSTGQLILTMAKLSIRYSINSSFPTDGQWHRVGYVYSFLYGQLTLYIDDIEVAVIKTSFGVINLHQSGISLFDRNSGSADTINGSQPYLGLMDHVVVSIHEEDAFLYDLCQLSKMSCPKYAFLVQDLNSKWNTIDLLTGSDTTRNDSFSSQINGIGYNITDNRIWGVQSIAQIGKLTVTSQNINGSFTTLISPVISGLPQIVYNVGDVNVEGVLYLCHSNTGIVSRVDVNPFSSTYLQYLGTDTLVTTLGSDWAFNPKDSLLYVVIDKNELIKIDPSTFVVTSLGPCGVPAGIYGAQYFDGYGNLYVYDNSTGDIFRLDLSVNPGTNYDESKTVFFSTAASSLRAVDGSQCFYAGINLNLGDNPESYGTTLGNNGACHGYIDSFVDSTETSDLMLGEKISILNDGQPSVNADANPNDDGILSFPLLDKGDTTYTVSVKYFNATGDSAILCGWIDFDENGTFENDEGSFVLVESSNSLDTVNLIFNVTNDVSSNSTTINYARFRISTDNFFIANPTPVGTTIGGEVEDYALPNVVILPVEIVSFNVQNKNGMALLTWQTASEINSHYFEIEYSNNESDWRILGSVKGAGTSYETKRYQFVHSNIGSHNYYRLKLVDINGGYRYSAIKYIPSDMVDQNPLTVSPNPGKTVWHLSFNQSISNSGKGLNYSIVNNLGKVLESGLLKSNITLNITGYKKGIYTLYVQNESTGKVWVEKLVKM